MKKRGKAMNNTKENSRGINNRTNGRTFNPGDEVGKLAARIFQETQIQLSEVSQKLVKLVYVVGGMINRHSHGVYREWEAAELDRRWQLVELKDLSRELYQQVGAVMEVKFELIDAIERLKKAQSKDGCNIALAAPAQKPCLRLPARKAAAS
jgi:hypothetical protein